MPARNFSRRFSLFYSCLFLGAGAQLPFLPLWLSSKGLDAADIGLILAAQMASRALGAPLGAYVADVTGARKWVMIVCAVVGCILTAGLSLMQGFWPLFALAALSTVVLSPVFPLGEAAAVEGSVIHGLDYGRMRLWGSLSFAAGVLGGGGALQVLDIVWVVPLIALGQGLLALACFVLPAEQPADMTAVEPGSGSWRIFGSATFLLFIAAASLGQSSHAVLYGFSALHWDHAGYQKTTIALFWSTSIAAEVLFFAFSKRAAALLGGIGLIVLGTGMGILRWPLLTIDLPMAAILLVQLLHAFTFGALHLGAMVFIQDAVPQRLRNTAQGLNAAIVGGIALSLATWAAGPLFATLGGRAYLVMAALSVAAFGCALWLKRLHLRPVALNRS